MVTASLDSRAWSETDRPGERFTVTRPLSGVEVVSVVGSHRHWREAHDSFTLGVVHDNQHGLVAEWRTRGRSLSTQAGDIMAIEPGDTHVTQRLKLRRGVADFDVVKFSPTLIAEAARSLGLSRKFHFSAPSASDRPSFAALGRLVQAVAAGGDALEIDSACKDAVHTVVSRLGEAPTEAVQMLDPIRDYRLRRIRDYLYENLGKRPTLPELATAVELCQYRLCHLFKRAYGISIGEYWNALRLAEAVRRLQRGTPIKVIVSELGYADEPYFWRVFKKHYGVAPGGWLSLYRANDRLSRRRR